MHLHEPCWRTSQRRSNATSLRHTFRLGLHLCCNHFNSEEHKSKINQSEVKNFSVCRRRGLCLYALPRHVYAGGDERCCSRISLPVREACCSCPSPPFCRDLHPAAGKSDDAS